MRVLLVEDDPELRMLLEVLLGEHHEVLVADGTAAARSTLASEHVDVVVLDVAVQTDEEGGAPTPSLPDRLRGAPRAAALPVAVIGGRGRADAAESGALGAGAEAAEDNAARTETAGAEAADAYLAWPVSPHELLATVERLGALDPEQLTAHRQAAAGRGALIAELTRGASGR